MSRQALLILSSRSALRQRHGDLQVERIPAGVDYDEDCIARLVPEHSWFRSRRLERRDRGSDEGCSSSHLLRTPIRRLLQRRSSGLEGADGDGRENAGHDQ